MIYVAAWALLLYQRAQSLFDWGRGGGGGGGGVGG